MGHRPQWHEWIHMESKRRYVIRIPPIALHGLNQILETSQNCDSPLHNTSSFRNQSMFKSQSHGGNVCITFASFQVDVGSQDRERMDRRIQCLPQNERREKISNLCGYVIPRTRCGWGGPKEKGFEPMDCEFGLVRCSCNDGCYHIMILLVAGDFRK